MTTFHIRTGAPHDLGAVVALDQATALLPHWCEKDYAAALLCNQESGTVVHRILLVADRGGVLSGFAVVKISILSHEVSSELESLAVAASSRRSGIGRALCMEAIDWALRRHATSMELEVRSRNDPAIALYTGLGFVAEGTRRMYYSDPTDDAVLMRLALQG